METENIFDGVEAAVNSVPVADTKVSLDNQQTLRCETTTDVKVPAKDANDFHVMCRAKDLQFVYDQLSRTKRQLKTRISLITDLAGMISAASFSLFCTLWMSVKIVSLIYLVISILFIMSTWVWTWRRFASNSNIVEHINNALNFLPQKDDLENDKEKHDEC